MLCGCSGELNKVERVPGAKHSTAAHGLAFVLDGRRDEPGGFVQDRLELFGNRVLRLEQIDKLVLLHTSFTFLTRKDFFQPRLLLDNV